MFSSPVPAPRIFFTYGTESDPPPLSHDLSEQNITPKGNPIPRNNPTNLVPAVPDDPDSDPSSSYFSSSEYSDSLYGECYKQR